MASKLACSPSHMLPAAHTSGPWQPAVPRPILLDPWPVGRRKLWVMPHPAGVFSQERRAPSGASSASSPS